MKGCNIYKGLSPLNKFEQIWYLLCQETPVGPNLRQATHSEPDFPRCYTCTCTIQCCQVFSYKSKMTKIYYWFEHTSLLKKHENGLNTNSKDLNRFSLSRCDEYTTRKKFRYFYALINKRKNLHHQDNLVSIES